MQAVLVPWHPAAQKVKPSMPTVVPAPAGAMVSTKFAAAFWSELEKLLQFALFPVSHRLPVSFAGATGGTPL